MIVLSVTILVMAILAATALLSLEDSGIIKRSKNTVSKQTYIQEYERLQTVKNSVLSNNFGEITVDEYILKLEEKGLIENGKVSNDDGSVSVTTKTGLIANLMQDGESNIIISLGSSNATITLGQTTLSGNVTSGPVTKNITVTAKNVTGDIVWTSSNINVATVTGTNESATVVLKGIGQATITATYGNVKASCTVNVSGTVATPTITLNKTTISKTIDSGSTATETLIATTQNISGSLTWTSSNTSVVTVSSSGNTATITMKAGGTATITAKYGSTSASCTIVVTENVVSAGYTLSGVWTFYTGLYQKENVAYQKINFTSDGRICYGMGVVYADYTLPSGTRKIETSIAYGITNTSTGTSLSDVIVAYDDAQSQSQYWKMPGYATVDFGSTPQPVTEEFYNWFTANAYANNTNVVTVRIWFTDGYATVYAKPNSTWNELIGSGACVKDSMSETWILKVDSNGEVKGTAVGMNAPGGSISGYIVDSSMNINMFSVYYYDMTDGYIKYILGNMGGSND